MRNPSNEHPAESRGSDRAGNQPAIVGRAPVPAGNMTRRLIDAPTAVVLTTNSAAYNPTGYRSRHADRYTEQQRPASTPWVVVS